MNNYMNMFNKYNNNKIYKGFIDFDSKDYNEALLKRTQFLRLSNGTYLSHGGKDILLGYGNLSFEIHNQIKNNKPILFIACIGAGGPVGIFHCLSLLRPDSLFVIVQTKEYSSYIRSLETNQLQYNYDKTNNNSNYISDGIAVDCPESFSLKLCRTLNYRTMIIDAEEVCNFQKDIYKNQNKKIGNSTCITLKAFDILKNDNKINLNNFNVVLLDCEGNF